MSISDVIVVVEKKCDMFWRVDVMRSTQKKNHQNPSTNKKSAGGGSKSPPPLKSIFLMDFANLDFTGA